MKVKTAPLRAVTRVLRMGLHIELPVDNVLLCTCQWIWFVCAMRDGCIFHADFLENKTLGFDETTTADR